MSVFISYSSKDAVFVAKLAAELIKNRIKVWVDKFEMQPGDSLINKIQDGLDNSDFLIVVLSENSIESKWCQKELNSIMMSEIDDDKIQIIPILIDNCKIPVFLREKLYADFRNAFDFGFNELMRPLARLRKENLGRNKADNATVDYAVNWNIFNDRFVLTIDFVLWMKTTDRSVILQVIVSGDENATERYKLQALQGMNWLMKESLILILCEEVALRSLTFIVSNDKPFDYRTKMEDVINKLNFDLHFRAVLLGVDSGNDIALNFLDYIEILEESRSDRMSEARKGFSKKF